MTGLLEETDLLKGHKDRVWDIAWDRKGEVLASCSTDKTIRVWRQEGDQWICSNVLSDVHQRTIRYVAWSPCNKRLATTSFDGITAIWDRKDGDYECLLTLEGHENEVKCAAWSPSGLYLATCGRDKRVWIWCIDEEDDYECASVLSSHTQDVKCVSWHPTKDELVSGSYDNTIKVYKELEDDWECTCTLEGHSSTVWGVTFDKDGSRIASCSDDLTVKIWKEFPRNNKAGVITPRGSSMWKCVCSLSGFHSRTIYSISWNAETGMIATACGDNTIRVFTESLQSDENAPSFLLATQRKDAHTDDVNSVRWHPTKPHTLASASDDATIKLWRYSSEV